ncbi:Mor transcription activator family protein [Clostridium sp. CCUG 7971]|uniref:Mor transcription activator family protein n=1 Tax=Clostridium sp. CCUG 7971 TaxID=2811414 RepID=UPI001ABA6B32|nr:Mor transcription activator family protein [Clostridium sp. CCUG 7971]MBO3443705.1 transcriptional regulator [Clostridium sp. CCUG 7971]
MMRVDDLIYDDVPDNLKDISMVIGMDNFIELIKVVGGTSVYFPSENNMLKAVRNRRIRKEFSGDYKKISRMYGISEVQARKILRRGCNSNKSDKKL